ncbi:class I SAM-dependent methyltransferase [Streptomyces sp. NPDC088387]|uniref:class I SAM-dependent methyltransferase n=1 Tax=Streptomyces sp. NPDC088387 TaxID=3365859 RepID=UPI003828958C
MSVADTYVMGTTSGEADRLSVQGALYARHTEHLLRLAGLSEGMSVLDVGCGTGEVSVAAARIVGPTGSVVGVDMDPGVLDIARGNIADASLTNVSFEQGELAALELTGVFDAVVGRLIMMHLADPVGVVTGLTRLVRPGGLVTFQDFNTSRTRAIPDVPLVNESREWMCAALRAGGRDPDMGGRLAQVLRQSGLVDAGVATAVPTGDASSTAMTLFAQTLTSLLPLVERSGIATAGEVGLDTFQERLRGQCAEAQAIVYLPELVGAWARRR